MQRIVFDCETNPLPNITHVHLITLCDLDDPDGRVHAYHDDPELERDGSLEDGVRVLEEAKTLVAHNGLGFDLPHLRRLLGLKDNAIIVDTLVASRLAYSDLREQDYSRFTEGPDRRHIGSHSLRAWGRRLDVAKDDYSGDFMVLDQEMLDYGKQDVVVGRAVYEHLAPLMPDFEAGGYSTLELEQQWASELEAMQDRGVRFDAREAEELLALLYPRKLELEAKLQGAFPPKKQYYKVNARTGKRTMRRNEEGEMVDHKLVPFNPGSRLELARRLEQKYGWVPQKFTDEKETRPAMVEEVLMDLGEIYPEAQWAAELYIVKARIGILEEGRGSYLNLLVDGRIHGRTMHIGTITHRCSHSKPNLGNPCSVRKPWGKEIRALFKPDEGYVMAGGDASGLELRMLAHYLAKWDDGAFGEIVDSGDIHQMFCDIYNSINIGVSRSEGKTLTYAFLYGAGDDHLGKLCGGDYQTGRRLRATMAHQIQGMSPLLKGLEHFRRKAGAVTSLDGRRVATRSKHSALNTLLQSAGAVVMRWQFIMLRKACAASGIVWGEDVRPLLHVHDEVQAALRPGLEDVYTKAFTWAFEDTKELLGIRVPLRCEVKYGESWLETH